MMNTVTCINCKEPGDAREMTLGLFCKDCLRRMEEDELNAKEEELYDKLRKAL
jgi:reverse gyrase